ncbi:MAG: UDP-N-acetylmuramate--L-alanine ligase [Cytophagales bacterium]|nr:MAG: UDP-N-acetylmuramate--L-alanine ligase [Cytophagales bacterium]TAF61741.1 MAG: UDP-N-acetylmuramate--L-alanine ligase [Cytophagales bacterium]
MQEELSQYTQVYFVGIGGIGMSNLARWFKANGRIVAGYDRTPSPLTEQLVKEGIDIHYADDCKLIPADFVAEKSKTLVIFTPAVPASHGELQFFMQAGYRCCKRAEVLGIITNAMRSICIAGTHGKTTTSSMCAHLLHAGGLDAAAFLGGISVNINSNLLINKSLDKETPAVVEADEFDRSFLHLYPAVAIITSTDADHLDIYHQKRALEDSFIQFARQCRPQALLIVCAQADEYVRTHVGEGLRLRTYSAQPNAKADIQAENVKVEAGVFVFDYCSSEITLRGLQLHMPGLHNIENALAAITAALEVGLSADVIKTHLSTYQGVKRRFEFQVRHTKAVYIDDYAHHPTEIEAFLKAVKMLYPSRKLTAIFQPHLFSRTNDFKEGFAKSLELADEVILMDIYPARELPMPGVTVQSIRELMRKECVRYVSDNALMELLADEPLDVWVTVGAGDIDRFIPQIKSLIESRLA